MDYRSLKECVLDLEKHGKLVRIKEEIDPFLEMAAVHNRVFEAQGPALFFENIKGCTFPAVSNLFGTLERSKFMFRNSIANVQKLVSLKADPSALLKKPLAHWKIPFVAWKALPKKSSAAPVLANQTTIDKLPPIVNWKMDGGPFITLPMVYSEDPEKPGPMNANVGMYRIQLSGNEYIINKEIGVHYQIHRGIGVHQTKANNLGKPLNVSIFVGGPPSFPFSAVMPLPEGISELTFAGVLGGRRFRYSYHEGFAIANDADFVITGTIQGHETKPEGPFGDHLGYYSLIHNFPVMKVHKVFHRQDAIWPFTVVGRPPAEDTSFGHLIHELTGPVIPSEIPGVVEVHAVDAAGVHPLLLALGSERYTPYSESQRPQELLTIANHILGTGQMSLAKYLFIANHKDNPNLHLHQIQDFFEHVLARVDWSWDLHFQTQTTIDTLDYTGTGLNSGSKLVVACTGAEKRTLSTEISGDFRLPEGFSKPKIAFPGSLVIQAPHFENTVFEQTRIREFCKSFEQLNTNNLNGFPLIVLADDSEFTSANLNNWLWVTFTRSNPSHDVFGVGEQMNFKHWGCTGPLVIDARTKTHHAPPLITDERTEKNIERFFNKGGSLYQKIK